MMSSLPTTPTSRHGQSPTGLRALNILLVHLNPSGQTWLEKPGAKNWPSRMTSIIPLASYSIGANATAWKLRLLPVVAWMHPFSHQTYSMSALLKRKSRQKSTRSTYMIIAVMTVPTTTTHCSTASSNGWTPSMQTRLPLSDQLLHLVQIALIRILKHSKFDLSLLNGK